MPNAVLNEWMDGWMDGWMDRWMEEAEWGQRTDGEEREPALGMEHVQCVLQMHIFLPVDTYTVST